MRRCPARRMTVANSLPSWRGMTSTALLCGRGEVSGLFVGHDHMNDFRVNYKGI